MGIENNSINTIDITGDVVGSGTTAAPVSTIVGALRGTTVSASAPTNGQVLQYNASNFAWEPTATGATAANNWIFGDGTDGDVTINAGTTVLVKDMYYNNLTLISPGKITTNGYKIFVKGTLDITNAGGSTTTITISNSGTDGTLTASSTGGGAGGASVGTTVGSSGAGGAGGNGGAAGASGSQAAAPSALAVGNGNNGGAGGTGGNGDGTGHGNGGATRAGALVTAGLSFHRVDFNLLRGATLLGGGAGGAGGSGGGSGGTNGTGGGGGGGASGGGVICIFANTLNRSPSVVVGPVFIAKGGGGGGGANGSTGASTNHGGGGGGGAGGGGGWIYFVYQTIQGSSVTALFDASGGSGATGGNGSGGTATGGTGGTGGAGGRVTILQISSGSLVSFESVGTTGSSGSGPTGTSGGGGGSGNTVQVDL